MENEKQEKNKKIIKDALGRVISRDPDKVYFVYVDKSINSVNDFFKIIEKEIKLKGFVKLFINQPDSKKVFAKVKIKPQAKVACTSIPDHFALLNKVLTSDPNDDLVNHEWKTLYYCGYSGVFNPAEDHIRFNDINNMSYLGSEFKV